MDCREAHRHLYALADGELAEPDRAAVQAHVEACRQCRGRMEVQRELRVRLRRIAEAGPAPASLRSALAASLAQADVAPAPEAQIAAAAALPRPHQVPRAIPISRLFAAFSALAAMLALVVVAYEAYEWWPAGGRVAANVQGPTLAVTDTSPTAVTLADRLYEVHLAGQRAGQKHQAAGLPKAGREAAVALSRDLHSPVLWCGRLANVVGQFDSADYCEITDVQGRKHRGAHLLFRCPEGSVSLVSFPKLDEMAELKKTHYGSRDYAILCPSKCGGGQPTTIVGFNCPKGSHFVCAPMAPAQAVEMAEPTRPLQDDATAANRPTYVTLRP